MRDSSLITDVQIEEAIGRHTSSALEPQYRDRDPLHSGSVDTDYVGIRIAYEFLDAQERLKEGFNYRTCDAKEWVQLWAQHYISKDQLEIAAMLHPAIYLRPNAIWKQLNISKKLILPSFKRLAKYVQQPSHRFFSNRADSRISIRPYARLLKSDGKYHLRQEGRDFPEKLSDKFVNYPY